MSTRATVHFVDENNVVNAIIYVHSDGYPEGLGKEIEVFLNEKVKYAPNELRFDDTSYLAAHFLCWKMKQFSKAYATPENKKHWELNMIGVAPVTTDPGDIEYRYIVKCHSYTEKPIVVCQEC